MADVVALIYPLSSTLHSTSIMLLFTILTITMRTGEIDPLGVKTESHYFNELYTVSTYDIKLVTARRPRDQRWQP